MKKVYELYVYKLTEELSDSEKYKIFVDEFVPKLNAFINKTKNEQ